MGGRACPASNPIFETLHGSGVRCRIERTTLLADLDPSSLLAFCCGDYTTCPTWRRMREAEWASRDRALDATLEHEAAPLAYRPDPRERLEQAHEKARWFRDKRFT